MWCCPVRYACDVTKIGIYIDLFQELVSGGCVNPPDAGDEYV